MPNKTILSGTAHTLPADFKKALTSHPKSLTTWNAITPLARNEWICWVITVKQQKTRDEHVKRAIEELAEGQRRPCCWMGCPHRSDKPMNASQKWILAKQTKKAD